ncbi:MAG TPA: hypothetical protein VK787_16890, partial [Puia sp.]|jgi:hypothetical protein|nr:hypothetical protein [Puia sp.]
MTLRTLFNIILKILGIFFIKDFLSLIPQVISSLLFIINSETVGEGVAVLISVLLFLLLYGAISYYLIFKTDLIIDKLKLDKGFDSDTVSLNIHRSTVLSIAIIVIGGLLFIDEFPNFCQQLFSYFQQRQMNFGLNKPTISYVVISGIKVTIAFFLMSEQRLIVNVIERRRKKPDDVQD